MKRFWIQESFKIIYDGEILNNYLYIDLIKSFRKLMPSNMSSKNKNTVNEEPTVNKEEQAESRIKTSIKKLKKLRSKLVKNKEKLDKKLRKLLSAEGKEQKAERVNAKLEKTIKKEQKVFEDIRHKKEDRIKQKEHDTLKKEAKALKKAAKAQVSVFPDAGKTVVATELSPISEKSNQSKSSKKAKDIQPSKDQPAKISIKQVRRMTDIKAIENFMKGEKRVTVVQAAASRKNRLIKTLK